MSDLRYPIGHFQEQPDTTAEERACWIGNIASLPHDLAKSVAGLTPEQLDTPYRDGGWTVRQVVHHVADSHMHIYARVRFALTEDNPVIKPYAEEIWAELPDARTAPPEVSLKLLDALHERWVMLLRSLSEDQWARSFQHPILGGVTLLKGLQLYSWHGRHHVAHIANLRSRMGWV